MAFVVVMRAAAVGTLKAVFEESSVSPSMAMKQVSVARLTAVDVAWRPRIPTNAGLGVRRVLPLSVRWWMRRGETATLEDFFFSCGAGSDG